MQILKTRAGRTAVTAFGLILLCCGCGDDAAPDGEGANSETVARSGGEPDAGSTQTAQSSTGNDGLREDAAGRKWYGDIPLDVWFDDPLEVVANSATVPQEPQVTAQTTPDEGQTDVPAEPDASDSGSGPGQLEWLTVMPAPIFDAEIIRIRTKLGMSLNTVANYNLSMTEIPPDIGELAALANIAIEQDMGVTWGQNAAYVRDLAATMVEQPLMRGASTQRRLKGNFESIEDILNGNLPAGLPETDPVSDFGTQVDYGLLMKRIERGSNWLKTNIVSAESMKENGDLALQECHVVATVAKIITHEDYGYSEDAEYLGYARPMRDAALQMSAAIKQENFEQFDTGISQVLQACTRCHTPYRNN